MDRAILVLNAGSSSLKFSLFRAPRNGELSEIGHGQVEGIGTAPHLLVKAADGRVVADQDWLAAEISSPVEALLAVSRSLHHVLDDLELAAVGHRVVHGGSLYTTPVLAVDVVMAELRALEPLAPLHQPFNLDGVEAVKSIFPGLPEVVCFDTAFHRTQPKLAELFALPTRYYDAGVKRYGFHGLSYEYIAHQLPNLKPELATGRVVVAHLGSGCSMCALRDGQSMGSTMGMTALGGIPMGTRSGDIDPGALLYLLQHDAITVKELEQLLYKESGLKGLSGVSNDMRTLLDSKAPDAAVAVDFFCWRVAREVGSLAVSLGGLDALVFTAGVGANSPEVRQKVCEQLAWLGLTLDPVANAGGGALISTPDSRISAWAIPTNEELMIARHTQRLALR